MKASVFSPFFLLCQLHGTMQEFIDGRIHQMNFGFLCRTLKRIPEPLPNGRSKRTFNIPETESVAIESKFGDWKTFQN